RLQGNRKERAEQQAEQQAEIDRGDRSDLLVADHQVGRDHESARAQDDDEGDEAVGGALYPRLRIDHLEIVEGEQPHADDDGAEATTQEPEEHSARFRLKAKTVREPLVSSLEVEGHS